MHVGKRRRYMSVMGMSIQEGGYKHGHEISLVPRIN